MLFLSDILFFLYLIFSSPNELFCFQFCLLFLLLLEIYRRVKEMSFFKTFALYGQSEKSSFIMVSLYDLSVMQKKVFIFLGDFSDKKRVFEVIRMALGITLRGNAVHLNISPAVMDSLSGYDEKTKSEILEFLQAIEDMGSQYSVKNFSEIDFDESFDAHILVV